MEPENAKQSGEFDAAMQVSSVSSCLEDRFVGCLLAVMAGDILGTPFEGESRHHLKRIKKSSPNFTWDDFAWGKHMGLYHLPPRYGMYTDDTNSTLALATSLVEKGGLCPLHAAHMYGRFWLLEPRRGYPDSAQRVMGAVLQGQSIEATGTMCFATGSFANGGIMRIAPIGLLYHQASLEQLREAVKGAIVSSHVHPEAVDGALIQAYAISKLLKMKGFKSATDTPDSTTQSEAGEFLPNPTPVEFAKHLKSLTRNIAITTKLDTLIRFLERTVGRDKNTVCLEDVLSQLDAGSSFQIKSSEAIACALLAFLRNWDDPEACLIEAVGYGGDTDTIASIAALCGALHGTAWIPKRWYDNMENNDRGRDYAIDIAKKLHVLANSMAPSDTDTQSANKSVLITLSKSEEEQLLAESAALEITYIRG